MVPRGYQLYGMALGILEHKQLALLQTTPERRRTDNHCYTNKFYSCKKLVIFQQIHFHFNLFLLKFRVILHPTESYEKNFHFLRMIKHIPWSNKIYVDLVGLEIHQHKIIRILHECQVWIDKSVPRVTFWHHEARRNAAKLDFYSIYLEKCYNGGVRHFESKRFDVIMTFALSDEITYNQC